MTSHEMQPQLMETGQNADAPALLLQSFLDSKIVKELVTDGPGKASILEKAKQQINSFDPQEKVLFLEKTFAILSDPDPRYQDKRDAALDLLRVMDLTSLNPKKLEKSYWQAVHNLSDGIIEECDPYGEIHALLQAGKIIAPFIEDCLNISRAWHSVADAFTGNDSQAIIAGIQAIKNLTSVRVPEFDAKVLLCIQQGLRNQEIARELRVEIPDIQRSISRLKNRGVKLQPFDRAKGKAQTPETKQLLERVEDLRNQGKMNPEIASQLQTTKGIINHITSDLVHEGRITSQRGKRKRSP